MSESLLNWDDYIQVASLSDLGMREQPTRTTCRYHLPAAWSNGSGKGMSSSSLMAWARMLPVN